MTKTAWVFPGQGSQAIGMGIDLQELPSAKAKFERAEQILGWSVLELCQTSEEELARTLYNQPCLYVIESVLSDLLIERGHLPDLVAGHSLGEYVALYTARVFDFESGLRLVKRRAELMDEAGGGTMVAMVKFDRQQLEDAIAQTPGVVIANDNSAEQVVISGKPESVATVVARIKTKRAIPLKVSDAFHSPLMESASQAFQEFLESVPFQDAKVPVLSNVDPYPSQQGSKLKQRLSKQMTGSVRWREIMLHMPEIAVAKIVEVGPGKVLTGLFKRTCPDLALKNVGKLADLGAN